jgi:hypothetical protein
MGQRVKKVSLSVPASVASDLTKVSQAMGVSRSALASELLGSVLTDLKVIMSSSGVGLPAVPDGDTVRRARGASLELIQGRVSDLQRQFDLLEDHK